MALGFLITLINFCLRTLIIAAMTWIGLNTVTKVTDYTKKGCYYVTFFNSIILMLLIGGAVKKNRKTNVPNMLKGMGNNFVDRYFDFG